MTPGILSLIAVRAVVLYVGSKTAAAVSCRSLVSFFCLRFAFPSIVFFFFSAHTVRARGSNVLWSVNYSQNVREQVKCKKAGCLRLQKQNKPRKERRPTKLSDTSLSERWNPRSTCSHSIDNFFFSSCHARSRLWRSSSSHSIEARYSKIQDKQDWESD